MPDIGKGVRQLSSKIKKPAQFEMVLKTLISVLGTDHHDDLSELARHVCKEEVSKPLKEILTTFASIANIILLIIYQTSSDLTNIA